MDFEWKSDKRKKFEVREKFLILLVQRKAMYRTGIAYTHTLSKFKWWKNTDFSIQFTSETCLEKKGDTFFNFLCLYKLFQAQKVEKNVHKEETASKEIVQESDESNLEKKLGEIQKLKEKGIINDEEYEEKKKKIINEY